MFGFGKSDKKPVEEKIILNDQIKKLKEDLKARDDEIIDLKTDLGGMRKFNESIQEKYRQAEQRIKELQGKLEESEAVQFQTEHLTDQYNQELQMKEKANQEFQSKILFLTNLCSTLKSGHAELVELEKAKLHRKDLEIQKQAQEIQQKAEEIEKMTKKLTQLHDELQNTKLQLDQLRKNLTEEIKSKEFGLKQLKNAEAKQVSLEKVIDECKGELEVEIQKNQELKKSISELNQEQYKEHQKLEMEFKSKQNQLEVTLANQETKMRELESVNSQLQKEIASVSQAGENIHQEISKETPFISIENSSLFTLSMDSSGWTIRTQSLTTIKTQSSQKTVVVGMLGPDGSGKSWMANLLIGGGLPYGPGESFLSHNLTAFYPNFLNSGDHICVIDHTGFNKSNPHSKKTSILPRLQENASESKNDAKKILRQYQVLDEDTKIIKELEENFITDEASLLLYVTNEISQTDIRNICKIQRKLLNQPRGKKLIVIHNLRFLKKRVHVDRYLQSLSNLTPKNLWTTEKNKTLSESHFASLYKDDFGVTHLIMAQMDSEAGNFFNKGPIDWLRSKISLEERKSFDFIKDFVGFCNTHLSRLASNDIFVTHEESASKILSEKNCLIHPDLLCLNDTAAHFVIDNFQPRYSIAIDRQSEGMVVYEVYVELLDAKVEKSNLKQESDGRWYLILVGIRSEIYKPESHNGEGILSIEYVKGTREGGNFHLVIPLCKDDMKLKHRNDPFNIGLGLVKYSYTFEKIHEELMC